MLLRNCAESMDVEMADNLYLWRKNPATGLWSMARDVVTETASAWLALFQKDEPGVEFRVALRKPKD